MILPNVNNIWKAFENKIQNLTKGIVLSINKLKSRDWAFMIFVFNSFFTVLSFYTFKLIYFLVILYFDLFVLFK